MTKLNKETIQYLTSLSRIDCSLEEQESLLTDLAQIVNHIDQLQEVNTENIPPCNTVLEGLHSVMREDEIGETIPRDVFLSNAPSQIGGMIRVPPVIKQTSS